MRLGDAGEESVVDAGGEPEVEELHRNRRPEGETDVARLEIAVDQPFAVDVMDRFTERHGQRHGFGDGDGAVAVEARLKRLAVHQLHHVVGADVLGDTEVGDLCDPRAVHPRQSASLAFEAADQLVVPVADAEHLEGESASEGDVLDLEDVSHSASADLADDAIALVHERIHAQRRLRFRRLGVRCLPFHVRGL